MKLFVGRLPYDLTEEELRELFENVGTVESVTIIFDRETGRSRGFGFVVMGDNAQEAIDELNGSEVKGRSIVVSEAREKDSSPRSNTGGAGAGAGGGRRRY